MYRNQMKMNQKTKKEYNRILEESKGPDFGLVGMGVGTVDPKTLYNSNKNSQNVTNKIWHVSQRRNYKSSRRVMPSQPLDFNLNGINIPVKDAKISSIQKPPLPGNRIYKNNKFSALNNRK